MWNSSQGVASCGDFQPSDEWRSARCLYSVEGGEVWAVKEGAFEELGVTSGGGILCGGGKKRVISEGRLPGGVAGRVVSQVRVSMQGGDPSGAGINIVPHEDPCVWVLPGGHPVGTPCLSGAIGAQLQVSQQ